MEHEMKYKSCHVRTVLYSSLRENYRLQHLFYAMELRISFLLTLLILLWDSLCAKSKTAAHSDINERNSQESLETLMGQINRLQVRPENSVYIHPGQTLTLQCGGEGDEVLAQFWQTPFGLFDGCNHQNKDPVETCNGTLRISRATSSHDGLYYCVRLDEMTKTILPYRVNIAAVKKQPRKTREIYSDTVSESHFAAAVASSVIVSFLVAFTLGAFSRSYVIKCLRTIRALMPHRKDNHNHINGQKNLQTTRAQTDTVFFHKNQTTGEDTVDIGLVDQEGMAVDNGNGNENNESNEPQSCEGEEQTQELRSAVSPHPKKKIRVIKVYNYDEEGNPYSHIKDSAMEGEDEVRPRLRTRSLTRLSAIMKQAEALDINPARESTDGQIIQPDDPSHEATEGDTGVSQTGETHL